MPTERGYPGASDHIAGKWHINRNGGRSKIISYHLQWGQNKVVDMKNAGGLYLAHTRARGRLENNGHVARNRGPLLQ